MSFTLVLLHLKFTSAIPVWLNGIWVLQLLSRYLLVQGQQWKHKLTIKTPEPRLILNRFHALYWCFHCWLWISKCWLDRVDVHNVLGLLKRNFFLGVTSAQVGFQNLGSTGTALVALQDISTHKCSRWIICITTLRAR